MKNAYQKYKNNSIQTASREKILLMMYEGAIKFVKKAIVACEKKDISERGLNIGRAYDIILELNNTLDHDIGGEISRNLEQLYNFITDQLTKANVTGDSATLHSVIKILETLNDGWKQAVEKIKTEQSERATNNKS
jgi:flagellar protein FliS